MVSQRQTVGEQRAESVLDDFQSVDLDINSLREKFITPIDRYRSHNAPIVSGALNQPELSSSIKVQESRAHAFYRMLGLPVIDPDGNFFNPGFGQKYDKEEVRRRLDIINSIPISMKQIVAKREQGSRTRSEFFDKATTDATAFSIAMSIPKGQKRFTPPIQSSVFASLENPNKQTHTIPERKEYIASNYKKRDGSEITNTFSSIDHILAPFMTDPIINANVDPKSGSASVMIGAPFVDSTNLEYEPGKYTKRPGIEFILRLRLRQQNILEQQVENLGLGQVDLNVFGSWSEIGRENIREIASAIIGQVVDENDVNRILEGAGNVELYTLNDLVKVMKGVIHNYRKSIEKIAQVSSQIIWVPVSNEGGPEFGTDVSTGFVVPKRFINSWTLEQRIRQLQNKSSIAKRQLEIGENEDDTPLAFSDFTISEFQNISKIYDNQLQEEQNKRTRLEADASNALRTVEIISGEVSGLGLIDILAVYIALWSLDISVLLNLIDDTAVQRIRESSEWQSLRSSDLIARANAVGNAKEAYESFVNRIYSILSYADRLYDREQGSPNEQEGGDIPRDNYNF